MGTGQAFRRKETVMHDIDRTQLEAWGDAGEFESGEFPFSGETSYFGEVPFGDMEFEYESEYEMETPGLFTEAQEMELAAQLLDAQSEAELDQFFGGLLKSVGRAIKSPVGRAIGGMLKGVAKKALPVVGGALGNLVVPGLGGVVGSKLATAAGSMFGLELEGMSPEDQEFEVARRVVRLSGEALRQAAMMPPTVPPQVAAKSAVLAAAQKHAPGLVNEASFRGGSGYGYGGHRGASQGQQNGRWIRRGNKIVLFGIS